MKQITVSVTDKIADHEARLRVQEKATEQAEGSLRAWRWFISILSVTLVAIEVVIIYIADFHK